jgi:hypothetical protein
MNMDDKFERNCKEVVAAHLKFVTQNLREGKRGGSTIRSRRANHSTVMIGG